ncbi:MAG: SUMF1/EgtB/PvdO family nonheme iron enzyme [Anaerolineaceae bacterium]|nr:SUMF1/EgtB/PvdO family nonheme iron enzyme [Anaerolineaceae bacterium]
MKAKLPWIVLILFILIVGGTAIFWLEPLTKWIAPNSDLIQGAEALVSIVFFLVSGILGWFKLFQKSTPAAASIRAEGTYIGGDVNTGGGKFTGRDDVTQAGDNSVVFGQVNGPVTIQTGSTPPPARPPAESAAQTQQAYLAFVAERYRFLSFKGFGPSDTIEMRVPLMGLYVPLKARRELPKGGETWTAEVRLAGRKLKANEEEPLKYSQPQPVVELLGENGGLILLGDPGAGKSTFLKFLAVKCALGEGEALGLGGQLPVLIPLAAYANQLEKAEMRLDQFIEEYFCQTCQDWPVGEMLRAALKDGNALVLLDGLDEVKNLDMRHTVVERVVNYFTVHKNKGNKFVLTSRVVGYRDARLAAEGLVEATLVDFDDEEIGEFAQKWTAILEQQAQGEGAAARFDADKESKELIDAVNRSEGVRRLASNPLLLTILAVMKRQGVTLPERRVELYEQYVRTMLSTWNRARSMTGRAVGRDLDVVETVRLLAPLALWMHTVSPGVGLVKREDLLRELKRLFENRGEENAEKKARDFLADVHEHTALLLERGPSEYGFIHLTFEEYLAGVGMALQAEGQPDVIFEQIKDHVGDPAWREVALLAVGYVGLIQQMPGVAGKVLEKLVTEQPGEPGAAVALAGEAACDSRAVGIGKPSLEKVIEALITTMQNADVEKRLRRSAGFSLGALGWKPEGLEQFIEIPAGTFLYGDDKTPHNIPYAYWIAQFPVTNAQYSEFIAAGGHKTHRCWSKAGWEWKEQEQRTQPGYWDDSTWNNPIFPVVSVSWYEAEAYAAWRSEQMRQAGQLPEGCIARLPTEQEWEKAARGTDGREFPWGDAFDQRFANTRESGGLGTTAVCTYPQGVSLSGAWDMSGNVFEWTRSKEGSRNVLRGGSWRSAVRLARCAFRFRSGPDDFYYYIGFRLVLSLADSGS